MTQTTEFTIGSQASCSDGACGEVTRVVIDPVAETVTHLVVEPRYRHAAGRLVPLGLVRSVAGDVLITCTIAEFEALELAVETRFLPDEGGHSGYASDQVFVWPYYGLAIGGLGGGAAMWAGGANMGMGTAGVAGGAGPVVTDSVPEGDIAVYRGDRVHASDGAIGHVRGLVIDTASHHVTHVLLHEGHLFGRKDVAIPIGAVAGLGDGIQLNITKQQVDDLPPVDLNQPHNTGNMADDGTERPMQDDSSQDSRQPEVGPAITFEKPPVPGDDVVSGVPPYGEIIDIAPIGKHADSE
jgi:hypothetical protein